MRLLRRIFHREEGATAVEYAFMLALILMAVIATVATLGTQTSGVWTSSQQKLNNAGFGS